MGNGGCNSNRVYIFELVLPLDVLVYVRDND